MTSIALFTRNLRLHDNPGLHAALDSAGQTLPLFAQDQGVRATSFARPTGGPVAARPAEGTPGAPGGP